MLRALRPGHLGKDSACLESQGAAGRAAAQEAIERLVPVGGPHCGLALKRFKLVLPRTKVTLGVRPQSDLFIAVS